MRLKAQGLRDGEETERLRDWETEGSERLRDWEKMGGFESMRLWENEILEEIQLLSM